MRERIRLEKNTSACSVIPNTHQYIFISSHKIHILRVLNMKTHLKALLPTGLLSINIRVHSSLRSSEAFELNRTHIMILHKRIEYVFMHMRQSHPS